MADTNNPYRNCTPEQLYKIREMYLGHLRRGLDEKEEEFRQLSIPWKIWRIISSNVGLAYCRVFDKKKYEEISFLHRVLK